MTNVIGQTQDQDQSGGSIASGIVVGVDGSEGALHALQWAAARTDQFGPIQPVVAWHYPWWAVPSGMPGGPPAPSAVEFEARAREEAEEMLTSIPDRSHQALIVYQGTPGEGLVEIGRRSSLIVVGTRGRGAVADAVLGSVSSHVVRHAPVAVAVVPETAPLTDAYHRIVVGIDGSANAVAALGWAIRHAPAGTTIEAVHAWTYHLSAYPEAATLSVEVFEGEAQAVLDDALAQAVAITGGPGSNKIIGHLEYGDPRNVLLDTSAQADLLVLGARGHQGVAHLLVGSVTTSLVHSPSVATVVVPVSSAA